LEPVEQTAQHEPPAGISPSPPARPALPEAAASDELSAVLEPKTDVPPSPRARAASKPSVNPSPRVLMPSAVVQPQSIARIQVFVSANVPLPGVSRSFDMLSSRYPPEKALQMILRRAMDDYEERLSDGSFGDLPESYPSDGKIVVYTSRIMPRNLVDLSRDHFDPLGFESARAFGQKLANAALASFFAAERKHFGQ
jgi:hypothetical protein